MAEPANQTDTTIDIRPLGPVIGAEIHNVDLSRPLTDPQVAALRQAWLDHQVIFFRDQDLTLEQHIEFGKCFGELHIHPNVPAHPEHPEVLVIRADEKSKRVAGHGRQLRSESARWQHPASDANSGTWRWRHVVCKHVRGL
jgi:alpha-ketoglutarate-dependent taurine dioxygenase